MIASAVDHWKTENERICVLYPAAEAGTVSAGTLRDRLRGLREGGCRNVILNLEQVRDMDIPAIGAVLEESRAYRKAEGRLAVAEMTADLQEKCAVLGALVSLECFGTQRDALVALHGG